MKYNDIDDLDLSHSGLVDLIQNDVSIAHAVLETIFISSVDKKDEIIRLEESLSNERGDLAYYLSAIKKICDHMKLTPPLNFVFDGVIYAVNSNFELSTFNVSNP